MEVIKYNISSKEVNTGETKETVPGVDDLRSLVCSVYDVNEDDINNMSEVDLYAKYGDDFKHHEPIVEHQTGVFAFIDPGMGAINKRMVELKSICESEGIVFWSYESQACMTGEFFGELIVAEMNDEHFTQLKEIIKRDFPI